MVSRWVSERIAFHADIFRTGKGDILPSKLFLIYSAACMCNKLSHKYSSSKGRGSIKIALSNIHGHEEKSSV